MNNATHNSPENALCPRRTPWCAEHAQEFDQCLSETIDVGRHSVWLKLELDQTEATVVVDGPPSGDGLTLVESRKLAGAIKALEFHASCDELSWCAMSRKVVRDREGHQTFHESETIELAGGYSAHFYQNRAGDTGLRLILLGGPDDVEDTFNGPAVSHLLNAVTSNESWDALAELFDQVRES